MIKWDKSFNDDICLLKWVVNEYLDILLEQWLEHSVQRTTVMMFVIKTSYVATFM